MIADLAKIGVHTGMDEFTEKVSEYLKKKQSSKASSDEGRYSKIRDPEPKEEVRSRRKKRDSSPTVKSIFDINDEKTPRMAKKDSSKGRFVVVRDLLPPSPRRLFLIQIDP